MDYFHLFFSLDNKESSYLHAIAAAGVAYQITKGCSLGNWDECGCDTRPQGRENKPGEKSWEWGGCSENFQYGKDYSKGFMDPGKNVERSLSNFIITHNHNAGRKVCQVVFVSFFCNRAVLVWNRMLFFCNL